MLGITTEKESIHRDIESSKNDPAKQDELMAKTFNLPVNNYLSYFTNSEVYGNREKFDADMFVGTPENNVVVSMGIDLSAVNDICSVSFMKIDGEDRYFINRKYMPRCRVEKLPKDQRDKYFEWETNGYLVLHDQDYNEQSYIFNDIQNFMAEHHILPIVIGYDDWSAGEIVSMFTQVYGDVCCNVTQTTNTFSQPMKVYKELLGNGKIIFDDPVSTWNHMNVVVRMDAKGNIFPNKAKAKNKIDVFVSQLDAFVAFEKNRDSLVYYY